METTTVSDLGLVPRRRLGALLSERRTQYGYLVEDMARRSMGRYTTSVLEAIEAGQVELDDTDIEALSLVYEFNSAPPRLQRSKLIIADDEHAGLPLDEADFGEEFVRAMLTRYTALLYLLRNQPIGAPLPLRADDLVVLSEAFSKPENEIVDEVERIRATEGELLSEQVERMRRCLVVPAAGLLVGPTPAGTLIIVK